MPSQLVKDSLLEYCQGELELLSDYPEVRIHAYIVKIMYKMSDGQKDEDYKANRKRLLAYCKKHLKESPYCGSLLRYILLRTYTNLSEEIEREMV